MSGEASAARSVNGYVTDPGIPPQGVDLLDPANDANLPKWGLPRKPLDSCARQLHRQMLDGADIEPAQYTLDPYQEIPTPQAAAPTIAPCRFSSTIRQQDVPVQDIPVRAMVRPTDLDLRPQDSPTEHSLNWSGAWILPRYGQRFVSVWGSWNVPRPLGREAGYAEPSAPAPDGGSAPDAYRCSHWIGIGGYRGHSKSLPQLGTMTAVNANGVERYYAWYQWWEPTRSYGPLHITNLCVQAGDRIIAAVTVEARDTVRLHIRNVRTRQLRSIQWRSDPRVAPVEVDGESAEWVVERPSWLDTAQEARFFGLPLLEPVVFDCCHAEAATAMDAPRVARDLNGARLLRMVGRRPNGPGSRFLAIPRRLGSGAIEVWTRAP